MFPFFRREAKASASAPLVALSQLGAAHWSRRDAATLAREGYERNAVGYRCIRMIAEAAASVALVADDDHDALNLLVRPNADQSGAELMEAFYGHLQTAGNAYLLGVALDDGALREIHVLRPDRMKPLKGRTGWPAGWAMGEGREERRFLREADGWCAVMHMKLFHPTDDVMGFSPLEAASRAVDVHNAGAAWAKSLIDNSARPSGALVYGAKDGAHLTQDQFDTLKREVAEKFSGAENAGRPMVLEGGLDWKPMSLSPAEMDFIGARHAAAREIALTFGVPPMMLGIPGDNTYSNYKEANLAFWRLTILPLVDKAARALSAWMSQRLETPVMLRPDLDRVPALSSERDALWSRLDAASFATVEEKRALAGLGVEG